MKTMLKKVTLITIFFIVFIAFSNPLIAQKTFNGKIKFKTQDENGDISFMTYYSLNGKIRMDMADKSGSLYLIEDSKTVYTVMPTQKVYIEAPMDKIRQMDSDSADKDSSSETIPENFLSRLMTGKTKTILGYKCSELVLPDEDGSSMHIWGTSALGNLVQIQNAANPFSLFSQFSKKGSFFPLLTEEFDSHGKLISKTEVVEISKKKLDNSLFVPPAGYRRLGIPK